MSNENFTEQEKNNYLLKILQGEVKLTESAIESKIANDFIDTKKRHQQLSTKINQLSDELKRGQSLLSELTGRLDGLANLLISEEERRKNE